MNKKSVKELIALGYKLKAYSSGGDLLVHSFLATFKKKKVHGWFCHRSQKYLFD